MVYLVQHHGLKRVTVKNKKHSQTNLHEYQYSWKDLQWFLFQQASHFHGDHECSSDICAFRIL